MNSLSKIKSLILGYSRTSLLVLAALLFAAVPLMADLIGVWTPKANLQVARGRHTSTLLPNGTALIAGGIDSSGHATGALELYDPATDTFKPIAATLPVPVSDHTATLLQDGTILIVGGKADDGRPVTAAALFDSSSNAAKSVGSMANARYAHTATLLPDGTVLIAGGSDGSNAQASTELYDPASQSFVGGPNLVSARQNHVASQLLDGRVLIVGGSEGAGPLASAEIFNPDDRSVTSTGPMQVARTLAAGATLVDGRVLITGGQDTNQQDLASAEIFDPKVNAFTAIASSLATPRSGHVALQLDANGNVLVAGGTSAGATVESTELFDAATASFVPSGGFVAARSLFGTNFFAMPSGAMVLASGGLGADAAPLASSEAFAYPTVKTATFRATR